MVSDSRAAFRTGVAFLVLMILPSPAPAGTAGASRLPSVTASRADSYYSYCLAQQAIMRRDYSQALKLLEQAARLDPNSSLLALELGKAYLNLDEADRAIDSASRAAALDPDSVEPKRLLVDAYRGLLGSGNVSEETFNRAVAAHADLIAAEPGNTDARLSLARLYLSRDLFLQAAVVLRPLVADDPESVEAAYYLAQALLRSGSTSEAEDVLTAALEVHPTDFDLRRSLAETQEARGDLEGSARTMKGLVEAAPDRAAYRLALARLYQRIGNHAGAISETGSVIRALRETPADSPESALVRAAYAIQIEALQDSNKADEAMEAVRNAERAFPEEVRFPLKRAELLLVQGKSEAADSILNTISSGRTGEGEGVVRSVVSEVYFRAGARRERAGDLRRAESLLRRSIETDPGNHAAMNYLGYLFADRGVDLEQALDLTKKAVALDADNGAYLDSLGWVLFRMGRYDDAEGPLLEASKLIPTEPVVHDHLGDLYMADGRVEEAVHAWQEAIRLGAQHAAEIRKKIDKSASSNPSRR